MPKLTNEQLEKLLLEVIPYEATALLSATSCLSDGELQPDLHNHVLDSFAIHVRVLYNFLCPKVTGCSSNDVTAQDIAPSVAFSASPSLKEAYDRASTLVAHLTTDRLAVLLDPNRKPGRLWDYATITAELVRMVRDLYSKIDKSFSPVPPEIVVGERVLLLDPVTICSADGATLSEQMQGVIGVVDRVETDGYVITVWADSGEAVTIRASYWSIMPLRVARKGPEPDMTAT